MVGGKQGELTKAAKTTYLTMRAFPVAMVDVRLGGRDPEHSCFVEEQRSRGGVTGLVERQGDGSVNTLLLRTGQ